MDDWWWEPLRSAFGGRRVILAGAAASAWTEQIDVLLASGVIDVLVVAPSWGAGPRPTVATVVADEPAGLTMMEHIRHGEHFLREPPPAVVDAIDEFDTDRDALVLGTFLNVESHLAGRAFFTFRQPSWIALEDKVVIDAFWDRAGVERQPAEVVDLAGAAGAAPRLVRGDGTVWSADARDGFHGGATKTHWVADTESEAAAIAALTGVCDRVRVMPFIEGIPCSIHGIALPDGVAVLRPVEMVTLRRGRAFVYAGCADWWDPPVAIP